MCLQVHQGTAEGCEMCCAVVGVYSSDLFEQGQFAELKTSQFSCILKCHFREMQYSSGIPKNTFFPKTASGNWDGWKEVMHRAVGISSGLLMARSLNSGCACQWALYQRNRAIGDSWTSEIDSYFYSVFVVPPLLVGP